MVYLVKKEMKIHGLSKIAIGIVALSLPLFSATPIGIASSLGVYSSNDASINGSTEVFDGTALKTTTQPGEVKLQNGVDIRLATRSAGTIYEDHVLLQDGAVRASNFDGYAVEAKGYKIEPASPNAEAIVRTKGKTIEIASIGGDLKVTDGGAMLTRVAAGTKMAFQQTGASPASTPTNNKQQNGQILPISDRTVLLWTAGIVGATAIGIGAYLLAR